MDLYTEKEVINGLFSSSTPGSLRRQNMSIKKVYLELTNRCNLNCSICYRKTWEKEAYDMSSQIIDNALNQIKAINTIKEIVLGGIGEPTFLENAEQIMQELRNYHITLTTNGTLLEGRMAETIVETVDHVIISMDGMSDTFYLIRGFALEKIIDNIKKLNELKQEKGNRKPLISFQMVISKTNQEEIFNLIDLAASLCVSQVIISNLLPATVEDQDIILYSRYENEEMHKLFQKVRNYSLRKGLEVKLPAYQLKTERRCRFIEDDATMITASGDVVPCYRFAHDGTEVVYGRSKVIKSHPFGNITKESLKEIYESSVYQNYRSTVLNNHYPSCIDCDLVDGCDMVRDAGADCYGNTPSCADCLWSRNLIYCV